MAVEYLYRKDDIEFVPLLEPDSKQCTLIRAAHTFVYEISVLSSLPLSWSKEALEDLLHTVVSVL